ncbi:MAG: hypothetical protein AB1485_00080 [Candidatus Thermoplasmatota archaeon]
MGLKIEDLRREEAEEKEREAREEERRKAAIKAEELLFQTYENHGYIIHDIVSHWSLRTPEYIIYKRISRFKKQEVGVADKSSPIPPVKLRMITTDEGLVEITKKYMEEHKEADQLLDIHIQLRSQQ